MAGLTLNSSKCEIYAEYAIQLPKALEGIPVNLDMSQWSYLGCPLTPSHNSAVNTAIANSRLLLDKIAEIGKKHPSITCNRTFTRLYGGL